MTSINAWAADRAGDLLRLRSFDTGPLGDEELEIVVEYCGLCHSDLSMLRNEWGMTQYPFVPGHEVIGAVAVLGPKAKGLILGQRVGLGWASQSCMHCRACMSGDHQLCASMVPTIVNRHGGFADRVRCHWSWAIPLPDGIDAASAGPLFCGGITVFKPFLTYDIKPVHRVGVVGVGGLGHLALKFAAAWGCEVTAFTSTAAKADDARSFGAHHVISSCDSAMLTRMAGELDLLLVTVNAPLDWSTLVSTLAPKGRMHLVGALVDPIPVNVFSLLTGQRAISGSSIGAPADIARMLDFAARHEIRPQVQSFPMSKINDAVTQLATGELRYRAVLHVEGR